MRKRKEKAVIPEAPETAMPTYVPSVEAIVEALKITDLPEYEKSVQEVVAQTGAEPSEVRYLLLNAKLRSFDRQ